MCRQHSQSQQESGILSEQPARNVLDDCHASKPVKHVETAVHPQLNTSVNDKVAQRDWEGSEWRAVLSGLLGMDSAQIEALLESREQFGHGVVAGLVDVGQTWLCPASLQGKDLQCLEQSAVLIGLQEKHLTNLSNPRWLKAPLRAPGGRDL
uniref:Uncharacterized protein n=1 Tax=Maylandia zebra TaxID=106582 RepID=A0A3P9B3L6_9CICH